MERVEDPALLKASELTLLIVVPVALKAAINLKVMNVLADYKHEKNQEGGGLSASEIALRMSERYHIHASHEVLERILRLLASYGVFDSSQSLEKDEGNEQTNIVVGLERDEGDEKTDVYCLTKYALNSVSNYFIPQGDFKQSKQEETKEENLRHSEGLASNASFLSLLLDRAFMETWPFVEDSILDPSLPAFTRAHGRDFFSYCQGNPQFGILFDSAMESHSRALFALLLEKYHGFSDIASLVDVGGGVGSCIALIASKYPHIRGINFDRPHVVAKAPPYPGVKHVGGDMFESVPNGDAILMKAILHSWGDEECIKILKICCEALPKNGKIILLEYLAPSSIDTQTTNRLAFQYDIVMLACCKDGKERTFDEFKSLSKGGGFSRMKQVCKINEMVVLELYK